jgi:hypothetical protein
MPTHSQETEDGMNWIQAAFWRVSHRMNKPYQWCNWQGFTYYVLLQGEERRRYVDFTQSQIDACSSDASSLRQEVGDRHVQSVGNSPKPV